jgi:hypothetical protein
LGTEKRLVFSQHPLIFDNCGTHLRNQLALVHRCIPGCIGGDTQFFHGLPGLLSHHTQLLSCISFVFCPLSAALRVPPTSFCCCSDGFRSSAFHLGLTAVGLLQFVFDCVRPACLKPRRSSIRSL